MVATKGEETFVEGHEEIGGRKRAHDNKYAPPAKREKVEGSEVQDCSNLGEKPKEEEEVKDKVERLRGLLKDNPGWLTNKDAEEVIRYLDVNDIISLASRSSKVEETGMMDDYGFTDLKAGHFVPSPEKVHRLMRLMLQCGIEKLKAVDLYILYNNLPKAAFASMLLHALDSYSRRRVDGGRSLYPEEMRVDIERACSVLYWKLFAHVMHILTSLPVFVHEDDDDEGEVWKKAAENCTICNGKGKHSGVYGYHCSYWHLVPVGVTVGSKHYVVCSECWNIPRSANTFMGCRFCGSQEGKAVPPSLLWDSFL